MNENINSLEHPQKGRKELWWKCSPKARDRKSTIITGMDTNKDTTYNRNLRKTKEDWNKERTREFFSKAKR